MMKRMVLYIVTIGLSGVSLSAADAPYMGTWKLNPAKSQLAGSTITIEKPATGPMKFTSDDASYEFDLDGKEYPVPAIPSSTAAWTVTGANAWLVTIRQGGKTIVTYKFSMSGDTMNSVATIAKPDGGSNTMTSVWKRLSGGPGLVGKWRSTEVKAPANTIVLSPNGPDGVTLKFVEEGFGAAGQFDGRDSALSGIYAGSKFTFAFKKSGANSFEIVEKLEGKTVYNDVITVSPDGKTLTYESTATATNQTMKAVYERQ